MNNEKPQIKQTEGKVRFDLLDPVSLTKLAQVMEFGANKYGEGSWRESTSRKVFVAAMLRHLFAYQAGQDFDSESGLSHLAHVGANWMILNRLFENGSDTDDRDRKAFTIWEDITG